MADLSERVVEALSGPVTSGDVAAVLAEAEAEFRGLEERADALDTEALSPLLTLADASAKRSAAADARFLSDRLDASCAALRVRRDELAEAERLAAIEAERAAALAERDALAADIAETYPELVYALTSLAQRIAASDDRLAAVGISESAESIGRGLPAGFVAIDGTAHRIGGWPLPMPASSLPAWSVDRVGGPVVYRGLTLGDG